MQVSGNVTLLTEAAAKLHPQEKSSSESRLSDKEMQKFENELRRRFQEQGPGIDVTKGR